MKFYIGSLTVEVQSVPEHEALNGFFRRPANGDAACDVSWKIEVVDKRDWTVGTWEREGAVWTTGRIGHQFHFDGDENQFSLRILRKIGREGLYWLRRDMFGGFGSISSQQILHSSAVIYDGEGYIFSAPSETGKTTLFNNLTGIAEQVNDESNWVYQNDAGAYMLVNQNYYFGLSDVCEVPVHAIYLLRQSPTCHIEEVENNMEAFTILLSIHPPFDYFDPFLEERSAAIRTLQKEVPIKVFHLNRNRDELAATLFGDR